MGFDIRTASVLSGLTTSQLRAWSKESVFVPEYNDQPIPEYSFRDIVAARTLSFLRADCSAQNVKKAVRNLRNLNHRGHLAKYKIGHDGDIIVLEDEDGVTVNLTGTVGQGRAFSFGEVWGPFKNFKEEEVPALQNPRPNLEVDEERLGGWPTVSGTRIGFDTIAGFIDNDTVTPDDIHYFFPSVTAEAAHDAVSLMEAVNAA